MTAGRPYILPPWSADAIRELLDTLNCLNNGLYESPKDLSDCLHATAESIRLVLDPAEFENDTPRLLDAIAVLYIALQLAANEAALFHPYPQDHADTFERWAKSAIDTVINTPGDQLRDLITGTLARVAQLRAELHHPAPPVVTYVEFPERGTGRVTGASPSTTVLPPWPAWLPPSPDDIPTAADPDYEELHEHY
ncbi:hypothetical protein [Leptolyngbya sp. KIOST-1]|uniref:hypothetical protein n=1 Tax=Leptolyngbya sp. KIOST-1 TaxID=1229172 RepID=UPI00055C1BC8|nr:hypothetical protein [Leptolyngbya sp. KIOST-1]